MNVLEGRIIVSLCEAMIQLGVPVPALLLLSRPHSSQAREIGVISPYRAQVRAISTQLAGMGEGSKGIECSTVDRYQGRDKECILVSLVRSKQDEEVEEASLTT